MERNRFARIGKGVLSKAIGLQANYTEYYEKGPDALNERASGCQSCPIHKVKEDLLLFGCTAEAEYIHSQCRDCSSSVWHHTYKRKVYINEKNRYGYQPTLKSNSIKLLLLYHFLQPDARGFVRNVRISELAEVIGCTIPTILSCNEVLKEYGYCYFTPGGWEDGVITVLLPEYKDYHKTAAEGGRGYITMSDAMLEKLLCFKGLNTLRLNLKALLLVDNESAGEAKNEPLKPVSSSYKKLRGFLPAYCKRNVIKRSLEGIDSIFSTQLNDKTVVFEIREEFTQRKMREAMVLDAEEELKEYVENLNDILEQAEETQFTEDAERTEQLLSSFHISSCGKYPALSVTLSDYSDLASLAVQYNMSLVQQALGVIYSQYICRNHPVDSFGALARTIIRRHPVFSEVA